MSDTRTDVEKVAHEENETQAALDAGVALAEPRLLVPGTPVSVVVPKGAEHRVVRVAAADREFEAAPLRARGTYRPATVAALIDVVKRHHDPDTTTVWVHPDNGSVIAVFNDNTSAEPAWRDHRAQLNLTVPPEWKHWASRDGQLIGQVEFAEHIEDGLAEIVEPVAADMLEIAQTFHAHTDAQFRSSNRLHSGEVRIQYDESTTASAGKSGEMQIPETFKLAIAPFLGEERYAVQARLRHRVAGGNLKLGYKLDRPDVVVRHALDKIAELLSKEFPSVVIGTPGE